MIHAVTNDDILGRSDFLSRARAVMSALGPRGAVQLRGPRTEGADLFRVGEALAALQAETGAWLIVTDRVDVAAAVGARGVQLTAQSLDCSDVRFVSTELAVGASVHSPAEALAARENGASWGVIGNVLAGRKSAGAGHGMALLAEVIRASTLPMIVIGGVVPQHVAPLRRAGAFGVAAIRGIWDAENAGDGALDYLSSYDHRADQ